jgi:allantoate deiminase
VLAIEARAASEPELVATVGKLETLPGAMNVIPGRVKFSLDLRAPRDAQREKAVADVLAKLHSICERRGVKLHPNKMHDEPVAKCADWMQAQIAAAIEGEGLKVRALPSGAGHDGMAIQAIADIGMLFVRCKSGVSHNPAEAISEEDAGTATRVLLRFIEKFTVPAAISGPARVSKFPGEPRQS